MHLHDFSITLIYKDKSLCFVYFDFVYFVYNAILYCTQT